MKGGEKEKYNVSSQSEELLNPKMLAYLVQWLLIIITVGFGGEHILQINFSLFGFILMLSVGFITVYSIP